MKKGIAMILAMATMLCLLSGCSHKHSMTERIAQEKTCITDGKIEHYCTGCDYKYTETIDASHDYEETILKESTCITNGTARYTCKNCDATFTKDLSLGSHKYDGKYCSVCGEKKVGKITNPYLPQTYNYGVADIVVQSTCKITKVKAEINYGIMTVLFTGTKTYDYAGDTMDSPISFMMVIKDKYGSIIYSDQVVSSHIVVNQEFNIKVVVDKILDDSEDYSIELSDYMM